MDEKLPIFRYNSGMFLPTDAALGSWGTGNLDGRVVIGLLAAEIERHHCSPGHMPARLTVDLFRLPDASPVEIRTRIVRGNRRLTLIEADFVSGGEPAAKATCQILAKSANPADEAWRPGPWHVPAPDQIVPPADPRMQLQGKWHVRPISGRFGRKGRRRTWVAEARPLVDAHALTPFTRVALAADLVSAFANFGASVMTFINTDVTIYLHREPETEWIGLDVVDHGAAEGIAMGQCRLFDERGAIGTVSCAALAQTRR